MMFESNEPIGARSATRIAFLVAGFAVACWAPMVPYAKTRLNIDDSLLGVLLLCLGLGSLVPMMLTGMISERFGSRPVVIAGGIGVSLALPFLTLASTPLTLGLSLAAFGASLGSLDVSMNIHAVAVERLARKPLMAGFHALYSIGGVIGSLTMTSLLTIHLPLSLAAAACTVIMLAVMVTVAPRLLRQSGEATSGSILAFPRGIVVIIALLTAITFLVEGALLDWSALLVTSQGHLQTAQGGLAYLLFALAMTTGRLVGDFVTTRLGDRNMLLWGGLLAVSGFAAALLSPASIPALFGFALIGLGASNIVPVLFRKGGSQTVMPPGMAIAAISTIAYAGKLLAPASIGLIAQHFGLAAAFWLLAALLCLVPLSAGYLSRR